MKRTCFVLATIGILALPAYASQGTLTLPIEANLKRLVELEDTDKDLKITIHDHVSPFDLVDSKNEHHVINQTYALSVLLQEMTLAQEHKKSALEISLSQLEENPVDRTSRLIRELFWDSLTRRVDEQGLVQNLVDPKYANSGGTTYLYVPASDPVAQKYFEDVKKRHPELHLVISKTPAKITPEFIKTLQDKHGLLSLKIVKNPKTGKYEGLPYVVPGGRFNEMYGWDSYFITRGLLNDGKVEMARAMVDNQVYELDHYGMVLNANRTYYLTRSQPPFLTSMIRDVYAKLPHTAANKAWLKNNLLSAIGEYRTVWTAEPHLVKEYGLSRYFDNGEGPCPEVEPGGYDGLLADYAKKYKISADDFAHRYAHGEFVAENPELKMIFKHDRALRESGHDTTYRFDFRTVDFLTVDLNSLLNRYENDIADIIQSEFGGKLITKNGKAETASEWRKLSDQRRERMNKYLWNDSLGYYADFDTLKKQNSGYVSGTGMFALWAGVPSKPQAERAAKFMREKLEVLGGVSTSALSSRGPIHLPERPLRQWDFPYGWPPHQVAAWEGLKRYGLDADAERLAYRWVWMIAKNARDFNGTVCEKYDVEKASHEAFVEYGNVGEDFSYITREGFGWTNASYQLGLKMLSPKALENLHALKTPDEAFKTKLQ